MFEYNFKHFDDLPSDTTDNGRFYTTPNGLVYPSVTTVIGDYIDKSGLDDWAKRIGVDEANKIKNTAGVRGTTLHNICEKYILSENWRKGIMPSNLDLFLKVKPFLDNNVSKIYGIESPVYCHTYKTAGRTDLIADYDDITSIIDYKTSLKEKKEEWILGYFIQASVYAKMTEQLTGLTIDQIVIMIMVDGQKPQIFIKQKQQYMNYVNDCFITKRKLK